MIEVRRSEARGSANHGWLQSRHSFSFGSYYDPAHMGVSALRVINDDRVAGGAGFAPHSHQDMEIISYVKQGMIEHKDSMGNTEQLPPGEFQLMTAGTGVTHSEYNPSTTQTLEFLQIWIQPDVLGIEPGYQQKRFQPQPGLQLIASPDAADGSLLLHQDARLYRLCLQADEAAGHKLQAQRSAYLHVISGSIRVNAETLVAGDGATVTDVADINISALQPSEALLFDLP